MNEFSFWAVIMYNYFLLHYFSIFSQSSVSSWILIIIHKKTSAKMNKNWISSSKINVDVKKFYNCELTFGYTYFGTKKFNYFLHCDEKSCFVDFCASETIFSNEKWANQLFFKRIQRESKRFSLSFSTSNRKRPFFYLASKIRKYVCCT